MPVMVALLRGVNVGGRTTFPMAELRSVVESLGHSEVRTYIQSGNVVFRTTARSTAKVGAALGAAIEEARGVEVPVVVRTGDELAAALEADPFVGRGEDPSSVHLVFFAGSAPDPGDIERFAPEEAVAVGREIHLFLPGGMGRSRLAATLARGATADGTARNWRTVTKLSEMAASSP